VHPSCRMWGFPWPRKIFRIGTPRAHLDPRPRSAAAQPPPRSRGEARGLGRNCEKTASRAAEGPPKRLQRRWLHGLRACRRRLENHHSGEASLLRTHQHGETDRPAIARERSPRERSPPPHGPQTPCFHAENMPPEDITKSSSKVARFSLLPHAMGRAHTSQEARGHEGQPSHRRTDRPQPPTAQPRLSRTKHVTKSLAPGDR
jgi:hypothetical protein